MSSFEAVTTFPPNSDIATMDKLTAQELNCRVTKEPIPGKQCDQLGHLLPTIFQSFKVEPPRADQLLIYPSEIIHHDERIDNQLCHKTKMELVSLWEAEAEQWNWALSISHRSNQPTTEQIFTAFFNALTKSLAWIN
ncbi:hypothetical protein DFH29DRAFT_1008889 [Suillus ampliporus]|nr:hypothetical protein DFH29DRAFT_1008889 [Suillus ampliporus]